MQCGFCIPGMVICAKALLDANPNPGIADVKKAIRGNICRCTGYKKIGEDILMAGEFFREDLEIPKEPKELHMNEHFNRPDAARKVNGTGKYAENYA